MRTKVLVPVNCSDRLPNEGDWYMTNSGELFWSDSFQDWRDYEEFAHVPIYWYEEREVFIIEEENYESLKRLIEKGIPEDCINGYGEVKFCSIRNGEGNGCKNCIQLD